MIKDIWYIQQLMDQGIKLDCQGNVESPERLALAQQNALDWINSQERKRLAKAIAAQIKVIHKANTESLWYEMERSKKS